MLHLMTEIKDKGFSSTEMMRYQMYYLSERYGVSEAARRLDTTRKTVRHWRDRYREDKEHGLKNRSRIGQNHPLKMPESVQNAILNERKIRGNPGAQTIINNLKLNYSAKTVNKVLKRAGLTSRHKTRYRKKMDMRAVKASYKPMEKLQIDIKYYNDIANQYEAYQKKAIPKFQITARDYRTGMVFMGFTNYKDVVSTSIFAEYLIEYLKGLGTDLNNVSFQTDNGTEFVDPLYNSSTIFEQTLAKHGIKHLRIPPKAPTFNSDVESFHNTIEKEFLDIERFSSLHEFYVKSFIYCCYYNHIRKIRTRNNKSPVETYAQLSGRVNKLKMCYIPVFCDHLRKNYLANYDNPDKSGYLKGFHSISCLLLVVSEACSPLLPETMFRETAYHFETLSLV